MRSLLIQKLEGSLADFGTESTPQQNTVKQLKVMCKDNSVTQTGLKADLIAKLQKIGLFRKPDDEFDPAANAELGPRWFYFDEAFGVGAHLPFFLCICGASQALKPRMNISRGGVISPSLVCGNDKCQLHIWTQLENWTSEKVSSYCEYSRGYRHYNHATDKYLSILFREGNTYYR